MGKMRAILFILILNTISCGQKSEIDPLVSARPIGDGTQINRSVLYPLSEDSITSYEDPTLDDDLITRWINKAGYNIASWFGFAKVKIELSEEVPVFDPEFVTQVKISRIFLTIEEIPCTAQLEDEKKCKVKDSLFFKKLKDKKLKQNFDFLNSAVVKLEKNPQGAFYVNDDSDVTQVSKKDYLNVLKDKKSRKKDKLDSFDEASDGNSIKIADFNKDNNRISFYKNILIIKSNNSLMLKRYIKEKKVLAKDIKSMISTRGTLYVELKNFELAAKSFTYYLTIDEKINELIDIYNIQDCTKNNCLQLSVNTSNLVDFLKGEKNVFIQTYIDLQKVPTKMFQIRGYILMDTTVKIGI